MSIEIVETKDCAFCFKMIDARVTRCPYCCGIQDKKKRLSRATLTVSALALGSLLLALSGWQRALAAEHNLGVAERLLAETLRVENFRAETLRREKKRTTATEPSQPKHCEPRIEFVYLTPEPVDIAAAERIAQCESLLADQRCVPYL